MKGYQQQQAISILQTILLGKKVSRYKCKIGQPDFDELQVYYLLSDLRAIPNAYKSDWAWPMR